MYTRCSHCQKSQKLNADQLRQSRGFVMCVGCGQRFDALPSLVEDARQKSRKSRDRSHRRPLQPDLLQELRRAQMGRYRPAAWGAGCLAMLLLLLAQWFYFEGHVLTEQPRYYSAWQSVCSKLNCNPPPYRQLAEINIEHSQFSVAADQNWLLEAAMTNQALFNQAAPRLRLEVQDFNGRTLAERIFLPSEYGAPQDLAVQQKVPIQIRIAPIAQAIAGYHLTLI